MTRCLCDILAEAQLWSDETFGPSEAEPIYLHLLKEVAELGVTMGFDVKIHFEPNGRMPANQGPEIADVFLFADRLAYALDIDVAKEVSDKLAINQTRTWNQPDPLGLIEHDRSTEAAE